VEKALYIPIGEDNWLDFDVWNSSSADWLTGAVNADFTIHLFRDGEWVSPTGLYVHEIGHGAYHVSNSATPTIPYQSAAEEQVVIRVKHSTYGGWRRFSFWARDISGDVPTVTQIVNAIIALLGINDRAPGTVVTVSESVFEGLLTEFDSGPTSEAVSYEPIDESAFSIRTLFTVDDVSETDEYERAKAVAHFRTADLEEHIVRADTLPWENDTVTRSDSTVWIVRRILGINGGIVTVELTKDERRVW
jgi:hypothetical protein